MKKYFWAANTEHVRSGSVPAANPFLPLPGQHHLSSRAYFFMVGSPLPL